MAAHEEALLVIKTMIDGAVRAGASRHVVAALGSALYRCHTSPALGTNEGNDKCANDEEAEEIKARLSLIEPVVSAKVRCQNSTGTERAKRNIAEHAHMGDGKKVLYEACRQPQRAQRGGRGSKPPEPEPAA